jgi:hypothetical protein
MTYVDGAASKDNPLPGGDYTGDGIADGDDLPYATERYGGSGSTPITFTRTGLAPGEYVLTLKFAEIFDPIGPGKRVFDVFVNGQLAIDDLDLAKVAGPSRAYHVDLPVTIGANGTLTVSGKASSDNAKFSAIVLRELGDGTPPPPPPPVVSVAGASALEASGEATITFTRSGSTAEAITLTWATADGSATAGLDYVGVTGGSVTIPAGATTATATVSILDDSLVEGNETFTVSIVSAQTASGGPVTIGTGNATVTIVDDDLPTTAAEIFTAIGAETPDAPQPDLVGAGVLKITPGTSNVQISNYGNNSFTLQNTGNKKIAAILIDATGALYPDVVFDADGSGGDEVFKTWQVNSSGSTGVIAPSNYQHYWFPVHDPDDLHPLFDSVGDSGKGSAGGFRAAALKFSPISSSGFNPGETVGFSGDMDSNSIAGFKKTTVDANSVPSWDAGGVSGAEMIGSTITLLFTDGTIATGQLVSDGSQGGAHALVTQAPSAGTATLTVNGVASGSLGSYGGTVPQVVVEGPAGATIRVTLTKGIQPVQNTAADAKAVVDARVALLDFPANNAVEFQTVDITPRCRRDVAGHLGPVRLHQQPERLCLRRQRQASARFRRGGDQSGERPADRAGDAAGVPRQRRYTGRSLRSRKPYGGGGSNAGGNGGGDGGRRADPPVDGRLRERCPTRSRKSSPPACRRRTSGRRRHRTAW